MNELNIENDFFHQHLIDYLREKVLEVAKKEKRREYDRFVMGEGKNSPSHQKGFRK